MSPTCCLLFVLAASALWILPADAGLLEDFVNKHSSSTRNKTTSAPHRHSQSHRHHHSSRSKPAKEENPEPSIETVSKLKDNPELTPVAEASAKPIIEVTEKPPTHHQGEQSDQPPADIQQQNQTSLYTVPAAQNGQNSYVYEVNVPSQPVIPMVFGYNPQVYQNGQPVYAQPNSQYVYASPQQIVEEQKRYSRSLMQYPQPLLYNQMPQQQGGGSSGNPKFSDTQSFIVAPLNARTLKIFQSLFESEDKASNDTSKEEKRASPPSSPSEQKAQEVSLPERQVTRVQRYIPEEQLKPVYTYNPPVQPSPQASLVPYYTYNPQTGNYQLSYNYVY